MFALINWGRDAKKLGNAAIMDCEHCKNLVVLEIYEMSTSAGLFFLKVAKWNKKYVAACPICKYGCELEEAKIPPLLRETINIPDYGIMADIYNALDSEFLKEITPLKDLVIRSPESMPPFLDRMDKELRIRVSSRGFNPNHLKSVADYYFEEARSHWVKGLERDTKKTL